MNMMTLMIDGYNDDPREIFAIPEVRNFYQQLWKRWPYWLFFCDLGSDNLMMMVMSCVESLDAIKLEGQSQFKVTTTPSEIVNFIKAGVGPMIELCKRAGMSERQISERTKAVLDYFKVPTDTQPP